MKTNVTFPQIMKATLLAISTSIGINALLFLVFHSTGVIDDSIFVQPEQPLTLLPVVLASTFPTFIGALIFFLFAKFSKKGLLWFSILSLVLVVLSLASPFTNIPNVTFGYACVLDIMHIVVAGSLLFFLNRLVKANKA